MAYVGTVNLGIFADVKQALWAFKEVGLGLRAVEKTTKNVEKAFVDLNKASIAASLGMVALAGLGTKAAIDQEYAFTKATLAIKDFNLNGEEGQKVMAEVRNKATALGVATAELADIYTVLTREGYSLNEVTKMFGPIADFAKVNLMSFGSAAEVVEDIVDALDINVIDLQKTLEVLTYAASTGGMGMEELTNGLRRCAGAGGLLGVDLKDLVSIMKVAEGAGLDVASAGQQTTRMLINLVAPANIAGQWISRLGVSFGDVDKQGKTMTSRLGEIDDALEALANISTPEATTRTKELKREQKALIEQIPSHIKWNGDLMGSLQRLSVSLQNLTTSEREEALTAIAGKRNWVLLDAACRAMSDDSLPRFRKELDNVNIVEDQLNRLMGTSREQFNQFKTSLQNILAIMGGPFLEGVNVVTSSLTKFLGILGEDFPAASKTVGVTLGLLATGFLAVKVSMFAWAKILAPVITTLTSLGTTILLKVVHGLGAVAASATTATAAFVALAGSAVLLTALAVVAKLTWDIVKANKELQASTVALNNFYSKFGYTGKEAIDKIRAALALVGTETDTIKEKLIAEKTLREGILAISKLMEGSLGQHKAHLEGQRTKLQEQLSLVQAGITEKDKQLQIEEKIKNKIDESNDSSEDFNDTGKDTVKTWDEILKTIWDVGTGVDANTEKLTESAKKAKQLYDDAKKYQEETTYMGAGGYEKRGAPAVSMLGSEWLDYTDKITAAANDQETSNETIKNIKQQLVLLEAEIVQKSGEERAILSARKSKLIDIVTGARELHGEYGITKAICEKQLTDELKLNLVKQGAFQKEKAIREAKGQQKVTTDAIKATNEGMVEILQNHYDKIVSISKEEDSYVIKLKDGREIMTNSVGEVDNLLSVTQELPAVASVAASAYQDIADALWDAVAAARALGGTAGGPKTHEEWIEGSENWSEAKRRKYEETHPGVVLPQKKSESSTLTSQPKSANAKTAMEAAASNMTEAREAQEETFSSLSGTINQIADEASTMRATYLKFKQEIENVKKKFIGNTTNIKGRSSMTGDVDSY